MGKHQTGYTRIERDLYPTEPWVVAALGKYIDFHGIRAWECACGDGQMAGALRLLGCRHVFCSDIVDRGSESQNETFDFLSSKEPNNLGHYDIICTNPPFGPRGTLAEAFIESGLKRIRGGLLTLLLPGDFDAANCRRPFFANCPEFVAKIVLTKRIVWFKRDDGVREAPKENHAWFVWARSPLRIRQSPIVLYAPDEQIP